MKIFSVLLICFILAFPGCGNGIGAAKTSEDKIIATETSGKIPRLERSSTLAGIDTNANGVRDDIEAIINNTYTSSTQRAAAIQTAKALQKALIVNKTDIVAIKAVEQEISRGINCIYLKFNDAKGSKQPAQVIEEIEAITANTKQRLLAYLQFNKALDGTSSTLPEGDSCE